MCHEPLVNVVGWNLVSFLDQVIGCDTTTCTLMKCSTQIKVIDANKKTDMQMQSCPASQPAMSTFLCLVLKCIALNHPESGQGKHNMGCMYKLTFSKKLYLLFERLVSLFYSATGRQSSFPKNASFILVYRNINKKNCYNSSFNQVSKFTKFLFRPISSPQMQQHGRESRNLLARQFQVYIGGSSSELKHQAVCLAIADPNVQFVLCVAIHLDHE